MSMAVRRSYRGPAPQRVGDAAPATLLQPASMRLRTVTKVFGDLVRFAAENKVWWIVPLVVVLGLLALVVFTGQAVTPFVYTLW
jgi:ABC-type glucose/galactose transport system permease subunit